jgi:hypothetical protein
VDVVEAWVPLFLFSVLFGRSMDCQVFLLSRIRERYDQVADAAAAVRWGVASAPHGWTWLRNARARSCLSAGRVVRPTPARTIDGSALRTIRRIGEEGDREQLPELRGMQTMITAHTRRSCGSGCPCGPTCAVTGLAEYGSVGSGFPLRD